MTKKDYRIIAAAMKKQSFGKDEVIEMARKFYIDRLCVALSVDNPRFNEEKFREACE